MYKTIEKNQNKKVEGGTHTYTNKFALVTHGTITLNFD